MYIPFHFQVKDLITVTQIARWPIHGYSSTANSKDKYVHHYYIILAISITYISFVSVDFVTFLVQYNFLHFLYVYVDVQTILTFSIGIIDNKLCVLSGTDMSD